jgi:hypothetical protein
MFKGHAVTPEPWCELVAWTQALSLDASTDEICHADSHATLI